MQIVYDDLIKNNLNYFGLFNPLNNNYQALTQFRKLYKKLSHTNNDLNRDLTLEETYEVVKFFLNAKQTYKRFALDPKVRFVHGGEIYSLFYLKIREMVREIKNINTYHLLNNPNMNHPPLFTFNNFKLIHNIISGDDEQEERLWRMVWNLNMDQKLDQRTLELALISEHYDPKIYKREVGKKLVDQIIIDNNYCALLK